MSCGSLYAVDRISRGSCQPDSLVDFHTGMYQDWNLIQQDTAAQAKIEEEQRAEREAKERLDAVWNHFSAMTRPDWHAGIATPSSRRRADGVEVDAMNAP